MLERDVTLVSGSPRASAFQTLFVKASTPSPCFAGKGNVPPAPARTRGSPPWERLQGPGQPQDGAGQSCSPEAQLGPLGAAAAAPAALVAGAI